MSFLEVSRHLMQPTLDLHTSQTRFFPCLLLLYGGRCSAAGDLRLRKVSARSLEGVVVESVWGARPPSTRFVSTLTAFLVRNLRLLAGGDVSFVVG